VFSFRRDSELKFISSSTRYRCHDALFLVRIVKRDVVMPFDTLRKAILTYELILSGPPTTRVT
jgi:hypothetical protein